jgi:hypothetical protein
LAVAGPTPDERIAFQLFICRLMATTCFNFHFCGINAKKDLMISVSGIPNHAPATNQIKCLQRWLASMPSFSGRHVSAL